MYKRILTVSLVVVLLQFTRGYGQVVDGGISVAQDSATAQNVVVTEDSNLVLTNDSAVTNDSVMKAENYSTDCVPPCRTGYTCVKGSCIEKCNPPCSEEEQCTENGECISKNIPKETTSTADGKAVTEEGVSEHEAIALRGRFRHSVSVELPWNGIVGLGPMYTFRPQAPFAIEGGGGLSFMGLRYGIRGRYCFSPDNRTSGFVGFGFSGVSGSGGEQIKTVSRISDDTISFEILPTNFIQLSTGFDILTKKGIFMLISTGWAVALNESIDNLRYKGMSETEYRRNYYKADDVIDSFDMVSKMLFHGGLVLSFSIGWSFK